MQRLGYRIYQQSKPDISKIRESEPEMARDFTKISPKLWKSKKFKSLSNDIARFGFLYVMASNHQTNAGICSMPFPYITHDLDWSLEQTEQVFAELLSANLIDRDPDSEEIMVVDWFHHNGPMNKNHRKGILRTLSRVQSERLRSAGLTALESASPTENEPETNVKYPFPGSQPSIASSKSIHGLHQRQNR